MRTIQIYQIRYRDPTQPGTGARYAEVSADSFTDARKKFKADHSGMYILKVILKRKEERL